MTDAEMEQKLRRAHDLGYDQGLRDGRAEGVAEGLSRALARLRAPILELEKIAYEIGPDSAAGDRVADLGVIRRERQGKSRRK